MYDDELLRAIRERLGMTPDELGEAISTPPALLELWEAGRTKPRAGLWRAILEYMATRDAEALPPPTPAPAMTREEYARTIARAANRAVKYNRAQRKRK